MRWDLSNSTINDSRLSQVVKVLLPWNTFGGIVANMRINFFGKKHVPRQESATEEPTTDTLYHYTTNTEKYKKNLTTMTYSDLIDLIYHEENNPYKAHPDSEEKTTHHVLPKYHQAEYDEYAINEIEDDFYPFRVEEEYSFVLVKKAKPKPTLVMPTKLLRQLDNHIQKKDS